MQILSELMEIVEWGVGGYKSIVEEQRFSLDDLNVVVGRNNSGKSNLLDSILDYQNFAFSSNPTMDWQTKRVSGKTFNRKLRFYGRFKFSDTELKQIYNQLRQQARISDSELDKWFENDNFRYFTHFKNFAPPGINESVDLYTTDFGDRRVPLRFRDRRNSVRSITAQGLSRGDLDVIGAGGGQSLWGYMSSTIEDSIESWKKVEAFREPEDQQDVYNTTSLDTDGDNLTQVLHTLSDKPDDRFETIAGTYCEVMDGVRGIRTPLRENRETTVAIDEIGFEEGFDFEEISAGSKEILTLITQIVLAREDTDLLLIEEPELHLHPNAERRIYDLIEEIVAEDDGPQVLISTHSEVFVDLSKANSILRVSRDDETGRSSVQGVGEEHVDEALIELGYQKSDLFQASVVVFVEGRSDQRILEECSRTLAKSSDDFKSFDDLGIAVHPLGGDRLKKHGAELSHIVGRLRIPHQFVVDSDDQDTEEKKEDLRGVLESSSIYVLDRYCIESYLLESPKAIADTFRYDEEQVEEFIEENEARPNKKSVIKGLYEKFEEGQVSYDEEQHGAMIARHMDVDDIDSELKQLILQIQEMAG